MRRIEKKQDSEIVTQNLLYEKQGDRPKIKEILKKEQLNFCAFTEEFITAGYTDSIEHFNPYLKDTPEDNYGNWFVASQYFNQLKGTKNAKTRWNECQPIISLADEEINEIIYFENGDYIVHPSNIEAKNLLKLLHINHEILREERKIYIKMLKEIFEIYCENDKEKLKDYLLKQKEAKNLKFPTAIKAIFEIDVLNL